MKKKYIHFVGIKGVGMTALAIYCQGRGFKVVGSDIQEVFHTDTILKKHSITVHKGFNKKNINKNLDLIIYSGAYDITENIEIVEAKKRGIKIMSHGQALGKFFNEKKGISVAGTHGKTTSSALLATILKISNLDPSYVIGCAGISTLPAPGHFGRGDYFIAEADEYQTALNTDKKPRFLWQKPKLALITNIDFDHPDVFTNINQVKEAFTKFIKKIPVKGILVYNGDDKNLQSLVQKASCRLISFGEGRRNNYFLKKISFGNEKTKVVINTPYGDKLFTLSIPGKHNVINACGVYALASSIGINDSLIIKGIENFKGTKRRFEKIKVKQGIIYYDDYAHHPTEIRETLIAAKNWFPRKRIIAVFQPHTFSRTQALLSKFKTSFKVADRLILTEIFSSARENKEKFQINGEKFASEIKKVHPYVYYAKNLLQIVNYLSILTKRGDLVITMGAGDIYKLHNYL